MQEKIKISTISDSPKITSGFGNIANQIFRGLHETGKYEIVSFGLQDEDPDIKNVLPFEFWPCNFFDQMGFDTVPRFIHYSKPDLIFIIIDPGNLLKFLQMLGYKETYEQDDYVPKAKVVAYVPIEGTPINEMHAQAFRIATKNGQVILWTRKSQENVFNQTGLYLPFVYFGADHAPFRKFSEEKRNYLREKIGWDKYFMIGSVGTNKRTKGFPQIIYTAQKLKEYGYGDKIKFYLHTDPTAAVMGGYNLLSLARINNVGDMIMFKPDNAHNIKGIARDTDTYTLLQQFPQEELDKADRRELFVYYDYISRMNCLDLYLDMSEVEGWGMPVMEAMACGVPTVVVDDGDVRRELFIKGGYSLRTIHRDLWTTWNTGAKLANVDPNEAAKTVLELYDNPDMLKLLSDKGKRHVRQFTWIKNVREIDYLIQQLGKK